MEGSPDRQDAIDRSRPHPPLDMTVDGDFKRLEFIGKFLTAYRQHGNLTVACREANISRSMVYDWASKDKEGFAAALAEAQYEANDHIEEEIFRRSVLGYDEPVFYQGKEVATIRKFSDLLLIFLAKARMPEKYRDKFEGANLQVGGVSIGSLSVGARNNIINAITSLPEEELQRLADRGRSPPLVEADH